MTPMQPHIMSRPPHPSHPPHREPQRRQPQISTAVVKLSNGVDMPLIGLGTYRLGENEARTAVRHAVRDCGYRLVDTAAVYRNETAIGAVLHEEGMPADDEVFLTSKLSPKDHGYEHAYSAMSAALDRLQRRTLDLMLIHWPGVQGLHVQDARNAQLRSETWRALEQHYAEGHVRAIGVSNYTIGHLKTLLDECSLRPHVLQVELHPLLYQRELIEFCRREGIVVQAYSSFGEGALLRGGVTAGVGGNNDVDSTDLLPELDSLALRYSLDRATLLLHWALSKGIAVIPKSAHAERIRANIDGQLRHDVDVFKRLANDPEWLALDAISAQRERRFCWDPSSVR